MVLCWSHVVAANFIAGPAQQRWLLARSLARSRQRNATAATQTPRPGGRAERWSLPPSSISSQSQQPASRRRIGRQRRQSECASQFGSQSLHGALPPAPLRRSRQQRKLILLASYLPPFFRARISANLIPGPKSLAEES